MKRSIVILALLLLAWHAAASVAAQEDALPPAPDTPESEACQDVSGPNLLQNPSFEGEYSSYNPPGGHPDCDWGPCNTAQMAEGWTPYWRSHDPNDPPDDTRMPEYKPATTKFTDPVRVRSGQRAQQYFTFFSTHEAGFYQKVSVTPGVGYCFTIWGHSWSSSDDDPRTSNSLLEQRIGLDPTGGTDWQSADVVWGGPQQQYNEYDLFSLYVEAQSSEMTVYTWSRPSWPVKHNDVYWDDAALIAVTSTLAVSPQNIIFLAQDGSPQTVARTISITVEGTNSAWNAQIASGGTLAPTLNRTSGSAGDDLILTVDSSAYGLGTYQADLIVSTEEDALGSPATIPITLHVVSEIHEGFLPLTP